MAAPLPSRPARSLPRRLLRWFAWLALLATLALQLRILADGGLRLPAFVHDHLARRAAAEGFDFGADAVWLDPRGRLLLLRPRLGLAGQDTPFASARAIAVQLRRRALLVGELRATKVEATDLAFTLPALVSPTGAPQPLLEAGEFRLSRASESETWSVDQASAHLLGIPAAFTGTLPAPAADAAPRPAPAEFVRAALRQSGAVYRQAAAFPLEALRVVRVDLSPDRLVLATELPRLEIPAHPRLPASLHELRFDELQASLVLPTTLFSRSGLDLGELQIAARRLSAPAPLSLEGENVDLLLSARGRTLHLGKIDDPQAALSIAASSLRKTDTSLPALPLVAAARYSLPDRALALDLSTRLADADWGARLAGSLADRAGSLSATGRLTPAALELVRPFLPEKARPILSLGDPVALDADVEFAPGGRPVRVVARASSGRAVAHHVSFDRAAATLVYEPAARRLRADELLLVQDDSLALGSYEMNTETLAYRFLLGGRLRPLAIEGWFSGWWDRFWLNFAFGPRPPDAEVDIQGVWRDPDRTTLFIRAASGPMRLRELPLDTLDTRIRVADGSYDILGFHATHGTHVASGRFSRLDGRRADGADNWAYMDFDVRSDFPAGALPLVFPAEGPALVAPFSLDSPPRIHLVGQTHGPASATPGRQRYDLDLATDAPLRYSGFPLDHLSLRLERRDSDLYLRDIRAGFAAGTATGEATLSGPDRDRWLAFDLSLADADLDLAQTRWKEYQSARPEASPAPASKSPAGTTPDDGAKEGKPLGGRLSVQFAGTGPLDDPLAYAGAGHATITDADLARIRLMGPFSTLLGELGVGFATVKLTGADARLVLDRRRLVFDELRLTGPSALVEAKGVYTLPAGELDFKAKVRPFDQREGILGTTADFVLSPLSNVLEVELGGTLDDPTWTFTYGPTKLFRRITDRF